MIVSERFEHGVRQAASLIAHFNEEQAEIRLVIGGEIGEFGIGSRHLHECLKRLAVIEPEIKENPEADEIAASLTKLFEESENSHNFLISTLIDEDLSPELAQKSYLINF